MSLMFNAMVNIRQVYHYSKIAEKYCVFICTVAGGVWVSGDELPGMEGGKIWFLDRTQALIARDARRERGGCFWLPDYEVEFDYRGD